ncbi:MAG: protein tyrosine/serine phosphatase [Hydrocarboniphaga sp.]|uniref:tyrosine-protein phosphatase n=1 Tax=Hydrocarboniphaga sp. TaxID=2033016 RepID=UPI002618D297|nr:tyrosine-protein phosphatase [Hydrocarboniphaga sp.]MDB5970314.1 protein tyrosine/serine phosphatase [Hydrocarboniphaga sp.]
MGLQAATADHLQQVRCLPLSGAVNFRDLGGYVAADGRRVRWNQLFRSDSLAELSDADLQVLARVGLRTICDLRGEPERVHKPNRVLLTPPAMHAIGFMPHRGDELLTETRTGAIGVGEIESRVREIYRRFVTEQSQAYSKLLSLIEPAALPLLFHCTSGRDRTGFGSAVVLMALGVPRSTIEEDYALSNRYRRDLTFQIGGEVSAEVMATLTQAHPDYLAAAFAAIDEHYGTDTTYLRVGLGISAARQRELQALLLEP